MEIRSLRVVILHLAHWEQLTGGAELQLKYLATFLSETGNEVHCIYPNRTQKEVPAGVIINHPIKFIGISQVLGKTWFIYKKRIIELLYEIKPDIIITRTYSSWSGIAAEYALINNIRHIHFIASDNEVSGRFNSIPLIKPLDRIERFHVKKIYNGNTRIVTQNRFQSEIIKKRFNIFPVTATQAAPFNEAICTDKSDCPVRVVWIANFKPLKRPELFIEIVSAFKFEKDMEFVMIGGYKTSDYDALIQKANLQSNFKYLGELNNDEVNEVLNTAHILVNTSDFEGFSNTFIQAWLRNVVVISLNSNPDNILTEQGIGFYTQSIQNSIEKINYLVLNKNVLFELGAESRNYALKNHVLGECYYNKVLFN